MLLFLCFCFIVIISPFALVLPFKFHSFLPPRGTFLHGIVHAFLVYRKKVGPLSHCHGCLPYLTLFPRISLGELQGKWHAEPPPVLQNPCVVVDSVNNLTYMIGYDSTGAIVFNFVQQSTCSANWTSVTWTSLPYPGGGKPYYTEQCFLTANHHFGVQFEGGIAVWNQWARTWTYETVPCPLTYPNNLAPVFQDSTGLIDDLLVQWQDNQGVAHLTGIQLLNDTVHSCSQLSTT